MELFLKHLKKHWPKHFSAAMAIYLFVNDWYTTAGRGAEFAVIDGILTYLVIGMFIFAIASFVVETVSSWRDEVEGTKNLGGSLVGAVFIAFLLLVIQQWGYIQAIDLEVFWDRIKEAVKPDNIGMIAVMCLFVSTFVPTYLLLKNYGHMTWTVNIGKTLVIGLAIIILKMHYILIAKALAVCLGVLFGIAVSMICSGPRSEYEDDVFIKA